MIRGDPLTLLMYACAGVSGLGIGGALLLLVRGKDQKFLARVGRVTAPHVRSRAQQAATVVRNAVELNASSPWMRLGRLFGFSPDRQSRYPLRWWLVLGITLIIARLAVALASSLAGALAWLLLIPVWLWLSRQTFRWFERKYADKLFRQFPDALAMVVRAVRIGIPVGESIHVLAREGPEPTAQEFKALSDYIKLGVPLDEALIQVASRNDLREYRFFATALSLQKQAGGGLTETLENLADVIRKRVAARNRARALASEANTSAGILSAMPLITGAALWVINPDYVYFFFDDPGGQRVLALAAILLGIGISVMRYLIRTMLS